MASDPFIGEIRIFGFDFPPMDWALCDGTLLSVTQYAVLFSVLGTRFGGNGTTNFALPNLIGRVPLGVRSNTVPKYRIGDSGGQTDVTLDRPGLLPSHSHAFMATTVSGTTATATGSMLAMGGASSKSQSVGATFYSPNPDAATAMSPNALSQSGNGLPHTNMQPYLVLNFCIALRGIFPSRP